MKKKTAATFISTHQKIIISEETKRKRQKIICIESKKFIIVKLQIHFCIIAKKKHDRFLCYFVLFRRRSLFIFYECGY